MSDSLPPSAVTVGPPRAFHAWVWVGFPLLGAGAGAVLTVGLDWVVGLPWIPFHGPLELVDELTGTWTLPVLVGLGVVLGLVLALSAYSDVAFVTVTPDAVVITQDDEAREIARRDVVAVFTEGAHLVVQDGSGRRRARAPVSHLRSGMLEAAFSGHGYAWVDADPFDGAFSRWVENAPALPAGADAILAARQRALDAGRETDVEEFRAELDKVGVVVRDDGHRQFWRPIV